MRTLANTAVSLLAVLIFPAAAFAELPVITSVTNAASYTPQGLPNAGLAQGAMFVIKGQALGPARFAVANGFPLGTSIAGTSVNITVAGQTVSAIMYYAGSTQLAAILRSSTPPGAGTLVVTAGGQTSAAFPITVVRNALGIFTVSESGVGDAIATLGDTLVSPANSPNPGDTVAFWGTGLGAVTFDETVAAQQADLTGINVEVWIGGRRANLLFRGRNSCCTAVDSIYAQIPAGVSGCATPVTFVINNIASNTTSIPVASTGRTCSITTPGVSANDLASLLSGSTISTGAIVLSRSKSAPVTIGGSPVPGTGGATDSGNAAFARYAVPPGGLGAAGQFDIASFGACLVTTSSTSSAAAAPPAGFRYLDAGAALTVNGPGGSKPLEKQSLGGNIGYFGLFDQSGNYLTAGPYTISGAGGADIGAFSVQTTLAQPLTWTNETSLSIVNRSTGATVIWSAGDPTGYVQISGSSGTTLPGDVVVSASFTCSARASDGRFTVPPSVLLALPASTSGALEVSSFSAQKPFTASGLQFGRVSSSSTNSAVVAYR